MHWCLIEPSGMQYHPWTPLEAPLGGSQSALCYLSQMLLARAQSWELRVQAWEVLV